MTDAVVRDLLFFPFWCEMIAVEQMQLDVWRKGIELGSIRKCSTGCMVMELIVGTCILKIRNADAMQRNK